MDEREVKLTIRPAKKKIRLNIPEDLHVDDVIGLCMFIAALLEGMKHQKPTLEDHAYVANAGFEDAIKNLDTTLEKILDALFMITYEYKSKKLCEMGCAISPGYDIDSEGHIYVRTLFGEGINKWLEGTMSISEAIKKAAQS